jgi:hypothetical protein
MTLIMGEDSTIRLDIANSAPAGASIVSGIASVAEVSGKGAEAHAQHMGRTWKPMRRAAG